MNNLRLMDLLWAYVGPTSSISVLHLDKVDEQSFRNRFFTQPQRKYLRLLTRGIFPA